MMSIALWTRVAPRASVKLSAMDAGSMPRTGNARSRARSSPGGWRIRRRVVRPRPAGAARSRTTRCTTTPRRTAPPPSACRDSAVRCRLRALARAAAGGPGRARSRPLLRIAGHAAIVRRGVDVVEDPPRIPERAPAPRLRGSAPARRARSSSSCGRRPRAARRPRRGTPGGTARTGARALRGDGHHRVGVVLHRRQRGQQRDGDERQVDAQVQRPRRRPRSPVRRRCRPVVLRPGSHRPPAAARGLRSAAPGRTGCARRRRRRPAARWRDRAGSIPARAAAPCRGPSAC